MKLSEFPIYKSLLRNKLHHAMEGMKPAERIRKSRKITQDLLLSPHFKRARNIAIYVSTGSEVGTREVIRKALGMGKKIFVPRVDKKRREISFFEIHSFLKNLHKGNYGILEPRPSKKRKVSIGRLELVIVPGLGFDRKGGRLGRGEGYFDRFLRRVKQAKTIGLAFQTQILERIPMTARDARVDSVMTEMGEIT